MDPAERAAQAIVRRGLTTDVETMAIIIRNAYAARTEEIKNEIEAHCREVFEKNFGKL
jgi:hypothetical protein